MITINECEIDHSKPLVFREKVLPWIVASIIMILSGLLLCYLHILNAISERQTQIGDIFFGVLTAGCLPHAIPGFFEMKVTYEGVSVRKGFTACFYAWNDIVGNISAISKGPIPGITFMIRNRSSRPVPFFRINLFDTYGYPPQSLADTLNSWRRVCLQ